MKKTLLISILFAQAICCFSQSAEEFYNLGIAKMNEGDYKSAIALLTKSIEKEASYSAYSKRGEVRLKNNDGEEAIDDFTKAIALRPNLPETFHFRGIAKQKTKAYAEAIKDFDMAIGFAANYSQAYCSRAEVKIKLKDLDGAYGDYQKATLANPTDAVAFMAYGNMSLDRGNKTAACEAFHKAAGLDNKNAQSAIKKNCK